MKNNFFIALLLFIIFPQLIYSQNSDNLEKIIITNIGETVNTPYDEYAPIISADGLMMIFTSKRPLTKKDIEDNEQGLENVYVSYYDDMIWKWSEPTLLGELINQPGNNNSAIALSNDGQRMLLYRGDPDGNIYESVLIGEEWSDPVELVKPINSSKHESTASISPDGRTIYFVSNRKGGQGQLDIWQCHQDNTGSWGTAENLGGIINTMDDEEGVFIHPDGKTLYFSSKGHNTTGGYDIFKSVFANGNWTTPVNLGTSINTPQDDLFFTQTADGKTGYYSSGSASIRSEIIKENVNLTDSIIQVIQEAQILLNQQVKRVKHAQLLIPKQEAPAQLVIKNAQVQLELLGKQIQQVIKESQALLVVKEVLVRNSGSAAASSSDTIKSKYYNGESSQGSTAKLNDLNIREGGFGKKDIYEITFKNKKSESNLTLFKGVVIDFDKLSPLGAEIEISDNDKNEIIANISSNSSTGKYLVSLPAGRNYGIAIKKEGYLFYSENFNIPDSSAFKEINKNILLKKVNVGNTITLKNVFYDSGKATLKPESLAEINQLVNLMNLSDNIKIEIASYTDNQGKDELNVILSLARSQAVAEFLFVYGISKDQVIAKGYGESNPVASNDTEEGRQLNRRTEIKILE